MIKAELTHKSGDYAPSAHVEYVGDQESSRETITKLEQLMSTIAYDNVEYIEYSTPHTEALNELGEDYINNNIYNPSAEILANCDPFAYLEPDTQAAYNKAWESVRLASKDGGSSYTKWIIIGVIAVAVVVAVVVFILRKNKLNKLKYD